jgi:acetate kinase
MAGTILTINGGSSSVKFALFKIGQTLQRKAAGSFKSQNSQDAAQGVLQWLRKQDGCDNVTAIGHRIVHGGPKFFEHTRITAEMLLELRRVAPIDPDHMPGELALIDALSAELPKAAQVACFDTAFHRDLPAVARQLPIPRKYFEEGIRRYGFHGLSYSYLMEELARQEGSTLTPTLSQREREQQVAQGRIVLAHLGNGASMAAVREGKCIDTTMSFTPTAGLVMGTRCGDLDPGLLVYLMREKKMSADQIDKLINHESGMAGISGGTSDMQKLLGERSSNKDYARAVDIFCYQARKWIGAMAAALGGLDTLVFSGGIGENAAEVRGEICTGLECLGIRLDAARNGACEAVISNEKSSVNVRVIKTDEEMMIARATSQILQLKP